MWNGGRGTWTLTGINAQQILSLVRLPFRHTPKKEVSLLTSGILWNTFLNSALLRNGTNWTWTSDRTLIRGVLYQLSYGSKVREGGVEPPLPKDGIEPSLTPSRPPSKVLSRWDNHTIEALDCQEFQVRIELTIKDFADPRLTIWLLEHLRQSYHRGIGLSIVPTGFEPVSSPWKGDVLGRLDDGTIWVWWDLNPQLTG